MAQLNPFTLVWWCKNCEAKEPVEETGEPEQDYRVGDSEPCIDCGHACKVVEAKDAKLCTECEGEEVVSCFDCGGDGFNHIEGEDEEDEEYECTECAGTGELPCNACT